VLSGPYTPNAAAAHPAAAQLPVESVPGPEGGLKLLQQVGSQLGSKDNAPHGRGG
jgi:hypothetical protein